MVVLSNLNSLTQSLHSHTRCLARLPLGRLLPLIEPLAVMTDEQRQEAAAHRDLDSQHLQCEVVFPGAVQRYDHLTPELAGFCPVALLSGAGFLLPGSPRLGTLRWKGRLYICSSVDRAEQFGADPEMFLLGVATLLHRLPTLASILDAKAEEEQLEKCEVGSQTETHPVAALVDPRYQWNEWQLRREALAVAAEGEKRSEGVQAGESRGKRTGSTQVVSTILNQLRLSTFKKIFPQAG